MVNRSCEKNQSNPNLCRALVLATLLPACAATPLKSARSVMDDEINTTIDQPITYTAVADKAHWKEHLSKPVPSHVDGQLIEVSELFKSDAIITVVNRTSKHNERIEHNISIKPINKPTEECQRIPIVDTLPISVNGNANETPNIFLLSDFLRHISLDIESSLKMEEALIKASSDDSEKYTSDVRESIKTTFRHLISGYRIERTPRGVRFATQLVVCEEQGE